MSEADLADVRTAVAVLHRHGFVHGDIRPSNVLMQRFGTGDGSGDSYVRAYLLDFDWAGKAGEALVRRRDRRRCSGAIGNWG